MFLKFFYELKTANLPVTIREYLTLMEGLKNDIPKKKIEDFYYFSRMCLIKDERHLDKFDQVFSHSFKGLDLMEDLSTAEIPEEWLQKLTELYLSEEERKELESLGGWEKIMEELQKRLEEQKERHQGGNKWIGTGGTSPFGAYGYNPEGIRIGQKGNRNFKAIKVWDKREFKDLDPDKELGTRNMKVALRRLRQHVRNGAATEFDIDQTIKATAKKGYLDIRHRPERRNAVKLLVFFDVGGSMDWHIKLVEQLFAAAHQEFKHLDYYYFHNCLYDFVWQNNARRWQERVPVYDLLHKYNKDYKVIFVGDASMSPYELTIPGGSVEYMNDEPGEVWLKRVVNSFDHIAWLNPIPEEHWNWTPSIKMIKHNFENQMYPLTVGGVSKAMGELMR
ncbi:MAG: VWA domain-containing protein [Methyloligella sp.]|nr:MAG: VWA domain-containing protein [Methyloligella sp.]